MERCESSKGQENQKGQDKSHTKKARLQQIPETQKKTVEKSFSLERATLCGLWVKRVWLYRGLSHLLVFSQ
jgi:hypothetical protein